MDQDRILLRSVTLAALFIVSLQSLMLDVEGQRARGHEIVTTYFDRAFYRSNETGIAIVVIEATDSPAIVEGARLDASYMGMEGAKIEDTFTTSYGSTPIMIPMGARGKVGIPFRLRENTPPGYVLIQIKVFLKELSGSSFMLAKNTTVFVESYYRDEVERLVREKQVMETNLGLALGAVVVLPLLAAALARGIIPLPNRVKHLLRKIGIFASEKRQGSGKNPQ